MDPRICEVMGLKKMKKFCPISRRTRFMASLIWSLVFLGIPAYASDPPADGQPTSVSVRAYLTEGAIPSDDPNSSAWDSVSQSEFNLAPQVHWPDHT